MPYAGPCYRACSAFSQLRCWHPPLFRPVLRCGVSQNNLKNGPDGARGSAARACLMSGAGGMAAALAVPRLLQRVAAALAGGGGGGGSSSASGAEGSGAAGCRQADPDAARLAAEMLTNVCLFSASGYRAALLVRP